MKFLIVGLHSSGKQEVLDTLTEMGIKCGRLFSNLDNPSPDIYNSFNYDIFTTKEVNEIFENNAYIFINELDRASNVNSYKYFEGLTKYEFDNNDVFALSPDQLLHISPNAIKDDICFVWMDNDKEDRILRYRKEKRIYNFSNREEIEKNDLDFFVKTLYNYNNSSLIYFVKEDPCRVATIIYSIIKHPDLMDVFVKNFN